MKKTYRKAKQFVQDHDDAFFIGAVLIGAGAIAAAMLYVAAEDAKHQQEIGNWTRDRNFEGKAVYQLADGSYIAVSPEQVS